MKFLLSLALLFCSGVQANSIRDWFAVNGIEPEVSIGRTQFGKTGNGIWYQEGFHYTFDNRDTSYSIGASGYLSPSVRGRVAYTRLGDIRTSAVAVSDANYNGVDGCNGECEPCILATTRATIQGFSFTAAPEVSVGGFKVFAEAGAFLFRADFRAYIEGDENINYSKWHVGPQVGMGVGKNGVQLVLTAYRVDLPGIPADYITNFQGWATNLALRVSLKDFL